MSKRRLIVLDKEMDTNLGTICNAALKSSGMEVFDDVNSLIRAVTEEWEYETDPVFNEDDE